MPLQGAEPVAGFFTAVAPPETLTASLGSAGRDPMADVRVVQADLNGPGIIALAHGQPITAVVLEVADERAHRPST